NNPNSNADLVGRVSAAGATLPVVNAPLSSITAVQGVINEFRDNLKSALMTANGTTDPAVVQQKIYDALGPDGINVLGDLNSPANGIGPEDVGVQFSNNNNGITITIHLNKMFQSNQSFDFGTLLPAIPLFLDNASGTVQVSAGFDYGNLVF